MTNSEIAKNHRQEMIRNGYNLYAIFDAIEAAPFSSEVEALRKEATELAEFAMIQGLKADQRIREISAQILQLGMPTAQTVFSAWRVAVTAAYPSRKAMHLILHSFGHWLAETKPVSQAAFLDALPRLAPQVSDLGVKGLQEIIQAANDTDSVEDCRALLSFVGAYGSTTCEIILSACHIAQEAIRQKRPEYLKRIVEVMPPARTLGDRDAQRFIPALARLSADHRGAENLLWPKAFDVILEVAEDNHSSAFALASGISEQLQRLSGEKAAVYLEDCATLIGGIGIASVGTCLNDLPKYYAKHGLDNTRAFVQAAAEIGQAYGESAAVQFLERKTNVARLTLPA